MVPHIAHGLPKNTGVHKLEKISNSFFAALLQQDKKASPSRFVQIQ